EPGVRTEVLAFIDWMLVGNFTFLGSEQLLVGHAGDESAPEQIVELKTDSRRGLLRASPPVPGEQQLMPARDGACEHYLSFAKAAERVRVHRRIYPDFIGIRVPDAHGRIISEYRFMGLFTSRAYTMPSQQIPVLRRKIEAVIARTGYVADSHEYNEITRILEVHPRDEIFQSSVDELFDVTIGISQILERRLVRLFVRSDGQVRNAPFGKFVAAVVFMPRDLYNTDLRQRMQDILCAAFGA